MSVTLAMLVRPLVALFIFGLICMPIRLLVKRMPDSALKRVLLLELKKRPDSRPTG